LHGGILPPEHAGFLHFQRRLLKSPVDANAQCVQIVAVRKKGTLVGVGITVSVGTAAIVSAAIVYAIASAVASILTCGLTGVTVGVVPQELRIRLTRSKLIINMAVFFFIGSILSSYYFCHYTISVKKQGHALACPCNAGDIEPGA
jgi:hypothetical protein